MRTKVFSPTACKHLFLLFLAKLFLHSSEYLIAIFNHGRANVTLESLLIYRKTILNTAFSLSEYFIEILLFPQLKELWWISNLGLAMVVVGEIIRIVAMITAGTAFTHVIRTRSDERHKLVTQGIYKYMRHPGYCGLFICVVGTQILLCNPISTVERAITIWRFFSQRIQTEEYFLREFFGSQYDEYAEEVPSGLPFVK